MNAIILPEIRRAARLHNGLCRTTGADSAAIDRQVKSLLRDAVSLYQVDAARLKELKPHVIVTQAQCEACAVSLPEVEAAMAGWIGHKPQIISLSPNRLADVWEDIRAASQLRSGWRDRGREVLAALKNRVVNVIEKTCVLKQRPSVACIEWIEPLMAAGNWVPELVELAGGANVAGEPGKHSPWMDWDTLRRLDPEVIVVMPCGFDLAKTRSEAAALVRHPHWPGLKAVKKKRVRLVDGNQYFNRPGPRLVESLEILAEILHPDCFNFGHRGNGWEPS